MRQMKNSGLDWLENVPKDWRVIQLGRIGQFSSSGIDKKIDAEEVPVKIINYIDIYRNKSKIIDDSIDFMEVTCSYEKRERNLVEVGDVIFTPSSETIEEIGVSAVVYKTVKNLSFSYHVLRYHPVMELSLSFKKYMLNNHLLYNYFSSRAVGTIRKTLNRNDFKIAPVIVPPMDLQQKLANYLDQKISLIDNIIEKTKQSIEEYKKLKQSIITEAVTKGLNPDVKMKDSGIEWIGMIPEHWEVKKLKNVLKTPLKYGANESGVEFNESLPRYIRITDIEISDNTLKMDNMLSLTMEQACGYILEHNDILFARSGATVGKSFLFDEKYGLSAFAGYLIKAEVSDEVNPKLIYFYTLTGAYEEWKNQIFIQATIQNIGANKYSNMEVVYTSDYIEQDQIVRYVEGKISEFEKIFKEKETLIKDLESYKKSLIYEVVTGKKEIA